MSRPRIALLGGTFDPPHIGHLVLGECARVQFGCEQVMYVPAGDPYRKSGTDTEENRRAGALSARQITPGAVRLEMTRLAVSTNQHFVVDGREVDQGGPSYTVETLESYWGRGYADIVLVLGSDAAADLPNWREPERIRELARIVVAQKDPEAPVPGGFEEVDMPLLRVSSTEIRARVAAGKPYRYLVPGTVETFIRSRGLYVE
ncbi:MAG TPA: nicotinate (nicotinamide) nucleotide adenylyltransferase [Tepidiformaceae bacterium]|nr:nicotinate (nicotinamide) nucleotide adenylyltransferase [Tepidiformaceae bacterium]